MNDCRFELHPRHRPVNRFVRINIVRLQRDIRLHHDLIRRNRLVAAHAVALQVRPLARGAPAPGGSAVAGEGAELVCRFAARPPAGAEGREQPREGVLDRVLEVGQTRADDAAAGLDGAPEQGVERPPGRVMGRRALDQRVHPDDAGDTDEQTQREHQHHADLAHQVQLQPRQQRHRHQEHPQVRRRVVARPPPPEPRVVDAVAVDFLIPRALDWYALEDGRQHEPENAAHDDRHRQVTDAVEFLAGENAQVEHNKGQFGQAEN